MQPPLTDSAPKRPPPPPMRPLVASALLVVMGSMWGLQFAMLKIAAGSGYSDMSLMMLAISLLAVIFLAITAVRGELYRPGRQLLRFFVVTGALGYIIPLLTVLWVAETLSTGVLSMMGSLAPVVAVLIALYLRTEPVSGKRLAAVGLGLLSVLVILLPQLDLPGYGAAPWMLIALAVPLCFGIESVYIARHWPEGLNPMQVLAGESVFACLLVAPVYLLVQGLPDITLAWTGAEAAIAVFVAAGVVESTIYFVLIRRTGGVFVQFGTFVSLFAGIGWGIVLFSETHSALVWGAVGLLVVALWLVGRQG